MNEKEMQRIIARSYFAKRWDCMIPNCYTKWDNEADLFCMRKSGLVDEIEIKVSKQDFRIDERKTVRIFNEQATSYKDRYPEVAKRDALQDGSMSNYFWYAFPKGLVDHADVPAWAGIIEVDNGRAVEVRMPKRLHRDKMSYEDRYKQARKLGYRFWDMVSK